MSSSGNKLNHYLEMEIERICLLCMNKNDKTHSPVGV